MQPLNAAPRDSLTTAQVVALIEAANLEVDFGLELLDVDDVFVEDISTDLHGGKVSRAFYDKIHGRCELTLSKSLAWGTQRLKPYMTLGADGVSARFNLGVYLPTKPREPVGQSPATRQVSGFDKLVVLDDPIGSTHRVASGAGVIAAVEALITGAGETKIRIDQTSASVTMPSDQVWPIDTKHTRLFVINELLGSIGYRSLWVDWDGYYRSEPYESPSSSAPEWTYDTASSTTIVGEDRVLEADHFGVPNRWVFVRDDPAQALPADGAGLYVVTNQSDGDTSIDARGRTITRVERLQAATQAALVTQGDRIVEADKRVVHHLDLTSGPNPAHWHADVVTLVDAELGGTAQWLVQAWDLPLDGGDMRHTLRRVA